MKLEQHEVGEQRSPVPDTVTSERGRQLYSDANAVRRALKDIGKDLDEMRRDPSLRTHEFDIDVGANITLAFRAVEEASMRLGKTLQALDGGVSVYDKSTTVGA